MNKPRIIIIIEGEISHRTAFECVALVIDGGMISSTAGVPQYCFLTTFENGIVVYARSRSHEGCAHSFVVLKDGGEK